jgi:hypothetical protein
MVLKGKLKILKLLLILPFWGVAIGERIGFQMRAGMRMQKSHLVVHKSFQATNDLMHVPATIVSAYRRHNQ